jgi:LPS export ABC transporter protein LptC
MRWRIEWLALSVVLLVLASCSRKASEDVSPASEGAPDEVFSEFVTQESDSGKVKWRLTAPEASKFNEKKLITLEKPVIRFYDDKGELETTLTSEKGKFFEDSQDMLAFGNVVVKSVSGDVLETDSLFWINAQGKIISNSFVKLTKGNDVITGVGLECDYNLSAVNIKKNVSAKIIDEKGEVDG